MSYTRSNSARQKTMLQEMPAKATGKPSLSNRRGTPYSVEINNRKKSQKLVPSSSVKKRQPVFEEAVTPEELPAEDSDFSRESSVFEEPRNVQQLDTSKQSRAAFSIKKELTNGLSLEKTDKQLLMESLEDGDMIRIGKVLRNGVRNGSFSDALLQEVALTTEKPTFSLTATILANETTDDNLSVTAALLFMEKFPNREAKAIKKLEATMNSISSDLNEHTRMHSIEKTNLQLHHSIRNIPGFPDFDLNRFYNHFELAGETSVAQFTHFYVHLLKSLFKPSYKIWTWSYCPKTKKLTDKHFNSFPAELIEGFHNLSLDMAGCYLPDDLLVGSIISEDHPFLKELPVGMEIAEIGRRREMRNMVLQTTNVALVSAIKSVRSYHYIEDKDALVPCNKLCKKHLQWSHLKAFRQSLSLDMKNPDNFTHLELTAYLDSIGVG